MAEVAIKAKLMNVALNAAISVGVWGLVEGLKWLYNEFVITADEMENMATRAQQLKESLQQNSDYADRLTQLAKDLENTNLTLSEQNSIHEQMLLIQDDIIEKYGLERGAIDVVNDGIRETIELLKTRSNEEFDDWYDDAKAKEWSGKSVLSKSIDAYEGFSYNSSLADTGSVTDALSNSFANAVIGYEDFLAVLSKENRDLFENIIKIEESLSDRKLVIDTDMNADEAEEYLDVLLDIVDAVNEDGQYDDLYSFLNRASSRAENIISGSEKDNTLYYYDHIVEVTEGVREYYSALQEADEKYQEFLKNGTSEEIVKQHSIMSSSLQTFLAKVRDSGIEGADHVANYYAEKYGDILDSYESQSVKIHLTANDSELTSTTVAALRGLAEAGFYTAGQIKSAFDSIGEEGAAQFEQITGAVELTEEEVQKFEQQLRSAADQYNELTNGNVDYHNRPVVSAEKMWAAGWKEFAASEQATTYTQGYDIVDSQGIPYTIDITPILENGEVLSGDALWQYIEEAFNGKFNGVEDLLRLDDQKLIVHVEQGSREDNADVFDALIEDLRVVKESHLEAYNALNGYMTAAEGFKHIEKLAESMGKTFGETVDYLSDMGYFGAEFSNSTVSNKAQDIIYNFSQVMDVLNKARREQETLGYVTMDTVQELYGLSSTYDDISDVIEYNGEQYVFAADKANSFAEAQRKAGEQSLIEAGAITEDILALNSYYHNLGVTATRVKEYSEEAYELQEIQKKIAEGTGFTATELETLREEYGELPAMMDETTGLFYLEATAVETLTSRFSDLIEMIIELKQQASEEFGLQTLATQLGADINSYKVQKTYEGIMNRIQTFGIKSTEEYLKNAPEAEKYKDILDNYFATQDDLALWQGIYNKEYDVPEPTDSSVNTGKSDPWKEAFDKKYAALQHQKAMELITEEQYLNDLESLYKEYFAGREKYRDEEWQYEEEVFTGRKTLAEKWRSEQEELIDDHISDLEKEYEYLGDEAKVIEELNRLLAEKKNLMTDEQLDTVNSKILEYQENGIRKQIDLIEEEIDLLDEKEGNEEKTVSCYKRMINLLYDIKSVYSEIYDENSELMRELDAEINDKFAKIRDIKKELWEAQRDAQVESLEEEQDAIEDYQDAIEDILDATVDLIKRETEAEIEALEDARDEREEFYEAELDSIKEVAEARKEALEDELEGYRKIIEAKKEALRDEAEEEDYNDEIAKRSKEISDLQSRINVLALDDSKAAAAERLELEAELQTKKDELAKYQRDYSLDQQIEALDKELESFEESNDEKIELIEKEQEREEQRIEAVKEKELQAYDDRIEGLRAYLEKEGVLWAEANRRIQTEGETLWQQLRDYAAEYTRDVESLEQSWELALTGANKYNDGILNLIDTLGNLKDASVSNETTIKDLEDAEYPGEFTAAQKNSIAEIRAQMQSNSQAWKDAHAAGDEGAKNWWADQNQQLGAKLNEILGGEYLTYNKWKGTWAFDGIDFYKMPIYHDGGIVGGSGSLEQNELLAVLKKRELVLTEPMQDVMAKYIDFAKNASFALTSLLSDDPVKNIVAGLKSGGTFSGDTISTIHVDKLFDFHADNVTKDALPELKHTLKEAADYTIHKLEDRLSRRGIKTKAKTTL
ncbi:MAG: hypothetical protein J6S14_17230 [Clostridia bacterium]|nr:hypothetical protein [Clostridia bacterium]